MVVPPVLVVVAVTVTGDPAMGDPVGEATVRRTRVVMMTLQARRGPLMPVPTRVVAEIAVETVPPGRRGPDVARVVVGAVGVPVVTGLPAGLPTFSTDHTGIAGTPIPSVPPVVAD